MAFKLRKSELEEDLLKVIERGKHRAEAFQGSDNPQIVLMKEQNAGRLAAYQAVLDYIRGDRVMLRIDQ